jgi:hypothetical protein
MASSLARFTTFGIENPYVGRFVLPCFLRNPARTSALSLICRSFPACKREGEALLGRAWECLHVNKST